MRNTFIGPTDEVSEIKAAAPFERRLPRIRPRSADQADRQLRAGRDYVNANVRVRRGTSDDALFHWRGLAKAARPVAKTSLLSWRFRQ